MIAQESYQPKSDPRLPQNPNLQGQDCQIDLQKRSSQYLKGMNKCISKDAIRVLGEMSRDQSSLESIKRQLKKWTSLNNVCPYCEKFIRNKVFYRNIIGIIKIAEKHIGSILQQDYIQDIKVGLHICFSQLQLPHSCIKVQPDRMREEDQINFEDQEYEQPELSEGILSQIGYQEEEMISSEAMQKQSVEEIQVIDLQGQES